MCGSDDEGNDDNRNRILDCGRRSNRMMLRMWAFQQAMGAVWYYVESNPAMSLMGQRTLRRIAADTAPHVQERQPT